MTALLNSEIGDTDDSRLYIDECERMGIEIVYPDINLSEEKYSIYGNKILVGLRCAKSVGEKAARDIVAIRKKVGGHFDDFDSFMLQTPRKTVGKAVVESLSYAGAFSKIEKNINWIVTNYEALKDKKPPVPVPELDSETLSVAKTEYLPGIVSVKEIEIKAERILVPEELIETLRLEIDACGDCALRQTGDSQPSIPFQYFPTSRVMVVGENATYGETPLMCFKSSADRELAAVFKETLGITTKKLFRANMFACPPQPYQKIPAGVLSECKCAHKWLDKLLLITRPKVILSMGNNAMGFFTGEPPKGIMKKCGTAMFHKKYKAMVVFSVSPSGILPKRDPSGEKRGYFKKALMTLKDYL